MYTQIYLHPPRTKEEYNGWANVLYQGGSLEGVYRGLTLSREYRDLEKSTGKEIKVTINIKDGGLSQDEIEGMVADVEKYKARG